MSDPISLTPAQVNEIAQQVTRAISGDIERLSRAILGDPTVGHIGLVARMADTEARVNAAETHRQEGDRRAHERIDTMGKMIEEMEEAIGADVQAIRDLVNRIVWLTMGAAAVAAGGAVGVTRLFLGG